MVRKVSSSSRALSRLGLCPRSAGPSSLSDPRVDPGMLADIERVQMKSELADFAQQRADVGSRQTFSAVCDAGCFAPAKDRARTRRRRCSAAERQRPVAALLQAVKHVGKKAAVAFRRIVQAPTPDALQESCAFVELQSARANLPKRWFAGARSLGGR